MKTVFMRVQNIGKCNNKSAIAASAYRSGTKMYDETKDKMYNYSSKKEVVYDAIMLPEYAPPKYQDKQTLWQTIQDNEKASDARYCKDIMIAIPRNLTQEQRIELVNQFLFENFISKGYICQFDIHDKGDGNPHAHILVSARPLDATGQWAEVKSKRVYKLDAQGNKIPIIDPKTGKQKIGARGRKMWQREWAKQDTLDQASSLNTWKKSWRDICNQVLDKEHQLQVGPEGKHATIHLGPQAHALETKGIKTHIGNKNQKIKIANRKAELQAALFDVEKNLQHDKDIIEKERKEIERLKALENQTIGVTGEELHDELYKLHRYNLYLKKQNQEYSQKLDKLKLWTMKEMKQIARNDINKDIKEQVQEYYKDRKSLKQEENNLQKRIDEFAQWRKPGFFDFEYKKQYHRESEYLTYWSNEVKKQKEKVDKQKRDIIEYHRQPEQVKRYQNIIRELIEYNNKIITAKAEIKTIIAECDEIKKEISKRYGQINDKILYTVKNKPYKDVTGGFEIGKPSDILAALNKLVDSVEGPPLRNGMLLDLSEQKDINNTNTNDCISI